MIKVILVLVGLIIGQGLFIWHQIERHAEVNAALKTFQRVYVEQIEENQRIQKLLIEAEEQRQAVRAASQQKRAKAHVLMSGKPAEDCVNAVLPDDIRVLLQ